MPTLTVRREKSWADKIRKYRILVDGLEVGQIGGGDMLRQWIENGPHVIEAKIDWCRSQPFLFETQSEDHVVHVRSALCGWRVLFSLFYVVFHRREYLTLELVR